MPYLQYKLGYKIITTQYRQYINPNYFLIKNIRFLLGANDDKNQIYILTQIIKCVAVCP